MPTPYFSLRQFETLQAIAREGTLVAAAHSLNMTPAALTARLKALEATLQIQLFDRTSSGLRLNMAGEVARDAANRIEQAVNDFSMRMEAIRSGQAGRLSVAVVSTAKYFAPRLIAAFKLQHPGIELRFLIGNRDETIASLKAFDAEIALTGRPPAGLPASKALIGPHPYVIVAPPFHRLVGVRHVPKEALAGEAFLYREEGSGTRAMFEYFIGDIEIQRAQVGIELGSNETIKQAVMAGLGIALISAHTIAAEVSDRRLVCLDIQGLPIIRHWYVIHRTDRELSPVARAFHDFVAERGVHFLPRLVTGRDAGGLPTVLPPEE
jgi:LysR family transcriptional regulator, low CO2-responsive transcriptional regulator